MDLITLDVSVFILAHGLLNATTTKKGTTYAQTPPCLQYELNGESLPANTRLYAPSILGRHYYDHPRTNTFIHQLHKKIKGNKYTTESYIPYCLDEIHKFEQTHVASMQRVLDEDYILQHQSVDLTNRGFTKEERLELVEGIINKPLVKWNEHAVYIREKTYHIKGNDRPPNSIMFFCSDLNKYPVVIPRALESPFVISVDNSVVLVVKYDDDSKVFTIGFGTRTKSLTLINIKDIVIQVIRRVTFSFGGQVTCNLNIFDFTCNDINFPTEDSCLSGFTPQLLSSVALSTSSDGVPKLIYGTIPEDSQKEHLSWLRRTSSHSRGQDSSQRSPQSSLSRPNSPRSALFTTPSPARPNHSIVVKLLGGVDSFADFEPISRFDSRRSGNIERSVSPPPSRATVGYNVVEEVDGGGRRRRIVKKVFRTRMTRRCRRRHICTTVRSKRSNRRRGTKSKRKTIAKANELA